MNKPDIAFYGVYNRSVYKEGPVAQFRTREMAVQWGNEQYGEDNYEIITNHAFWRHEGDNA